MKNIYLVRHGQSLGNADESVYGEIPDYKIPLTDLGRHQAKEVANELNEQVTDKLYAYYSPMYRASETYDVIENVLMDKIVWQKEEPLISEQSFGMPNSYNKMFTNNDMMEYRSWYGCFYYTPPDGESSLQVLMRAKRFLDELKHRNQNDVLIISHGAFIKVFLMELLNWSVERFDTVRRPDNCQIIHVEFKAPRSNCEVGHWVLKTPLMNVSETHTDRN